MLLILQNCLLHHTVGSEFVDHIWIRKQLSTYLYVTKWVILWFPSNCSVFCPSTVRVSLPQSDNLNNDVWWFVLSIVHLNGVQYHGPHSLPFYLISTCRRTNQTTRSQWLFPSFYSFILYHYHIIHFSISFRYCFVSHTLCTYNINHLLIHQTLISGLYYVPKVIQAICHLMCPVPQSKLTILSPFWRSIYILLYIKK